MKILAIPASLSVNGINRQLVSYAAKLITDGLVPSAEVEIVDLNDYEMSIYSQEREAQGGIPEQARQLYEKIGAADAVVISFAEHNGLYTAAWKNTFDWMSRVNAAVYQGKPMVMFATSPGPKGGGSVLASAVTSVPYFGAELVGHLSIPSFGENFDAGSGEIVNSDINAEFTKVLGTLVS